MQDKPIQVRVQSKDKTRAEVFSHDRMGTVSDGYHTFDELYHYRMLYNAAWFNELAKGKVVKVVKSHKHSDGKDAFGGGWFVVVAQLPQGQITNHYENKHWDLFKVPAVGKAPEWDGHTPQQAADRIERYVAGKK